MQDYGNDEPVELRHQLKDCTIFVNYSTKNKNRSVAIVLRNYLKPNGPVLRNDEGNLLGINVIWGKLEFLVIAAYLPPNLDLIGIPVEPIPSGDELSDLQRNQALAHST